MRRPCGTSATPRARSLRAQGRATGSPNTSIVAAARRQQAHGDVMQVDLAGAVAAEQAEQARLAERERHVVQHVAVAVEGVDVAERERAQSPR